MKLTARGSITTLIVLAIAVLAPTLAHAGLVPPGTDLSGRWILTSSCTLPAEEQACVYEGSGELMQNGGPVNGQVTLFLISGPAGCPAEMMASVMGTLSGLAFFGTLDGGMLLGTLDFSGQASADGSTLGGDSNSPDGQPFAGTSCTWSAARRQLFDPSIPTLSGVALALLAVLLLAGGVLMLRRRQGGGASV